MKVFRAISTETGSVKSDGTLEERSCKIKQEMNLTGSKNQEQTNHSSFFEASRWLLAATSVFPDWTPRERVPAARLRTAVAGGNIFYILSP